MLKIESLPVSELQHSFMDSFLQRLADDVCHRGQGLPLLVDSLPQGIKAFPFHLQMAPKFISWLVSC